jgi:hypothetical protein
MQDIDPVPGRPYAVIPVATPTGAEAIYSILASSPAAYFTGTLAKEEPC